MSVTSRGSGTMLEPIDLSKDQKFDLPRKKIHSSEDVDFFLKSKAYAEIVTFILQLNTSMLPRAQAMLKQVSDAGYAPDIVGLRNLLADVNSIISEAPPEQGPRRFGNVAFRKWFSILESRVDDLLTLHLPQAITKLPVWHDGEGSPAIELKTYFLGSFGSSQRLDYGTGHELSFLAFLGCLWKLQGFRADNPTSIEKEIVLGVISPYVWCGLWREKHNSDTFKLSGSHTKFDKDL